MDILSICKIVTQFKSSAIIYLEALLDIDPQDQTYTRIFRTPKNKQKSGCGWQQSIKYIMPWSAPLRQIPYPCQAHCACMVQCGNSIATYVQAVFHFVTSIFVLRNAPCSLNTIHKSNPPSFGFHVFKYNKLVFLQEALRQRAQSLYYTFVCRIVLGECDPLFNLVITQSYLPVLIFADMIDIKTYLKFIRVVRTTFRLNLSLGVQLIIL